MSAFDLITLSSDFGLTDPFIGMVKCVIKNINPKAELVDIGHGIKPFNIKNACFFLERVLPYLPKKAVHLFVVDPGVGGERRQLILEGKHGIFVAPDNGLLTPILLENDPTLLVREISNEQYFLKDKSRTFHARDVFGPVAAWASMGIGIAEFGDEITDYKILKDYKIIYEGKKLAGEILDIDQFGNIITNIQIPKKDMSFTVLIKGEKANSVLSYESGKRGQLQSIIGSHGHAEVFLKEKNAFLKLKTKIGDRVTISPVKRKQVF